MSSTQAWGRLELAAVQMRSAPGDVAAGLRLAGEWTRRAAEAGARLVVLPEMAVGGYHRDAAAAVTRAGTMRALEVLAAVAAETGTWLLAPLAERDEQGRLYDSAPLFAPDGELVATKRKRWLWGWERSVFDRGEARALVRVEGVRTGVLMCYEAELPEPSRELALAGAELLLLPSAWSPAAAWRWRLQPAARALDNLCYVLRVNGVGQGLCGGSALLGPDGRERAALGAEEEGLLRGAIDGEELAHWRAELPYLRDASAASELGTTTGGG